MNETDWATVPPARRGAFEDLKIAALSTGLCMTEAALSHLGGASALTVHEYATTGGVPLRVEGIDINVPFDEWYCRGAELELDVHHGELVLRQGAEQFAVDCVHPLPGYVNRLDSRGDRYDSIVYTHIERIRLSPITGCAYDCKFCDIKGRVRLRPLDQLLEAADVALADERFDVRHALISGGSPGPGTAAAFADTVVALVEKLGPRLEVDVMMAASSEGPELVKRLVDAGVAGFAINIELESAEGAQHIRGKYKLSRPHFDATVSAATDLLGRTGRVRSLILPGLESPAATLTGVEHIASLGADPVLSPFRPAQGTELSVLKPVSTAWLREVLDGSREIAARHGVRLGPRCIPCQHNTLTFPWDVI